MLLTREPSMNQIDTAPEDEFRHTMSALPSPLKSPTPWIIESRPTLYWTPELAMKGRS